MQIEKTRAGRAKTRRQVDLMRELVVLFGDDVTAIGRAYARAEAFGIVARHSNSHGWAAEVYGRALYHSVKRYDARRSARP